MNNLENFQKLQSPGTALGHPILMTYFLIDSVIKFRQDIGPLKLYYKL